VPFAFPVGTRLPNPYSLAWQILSSSARYLAASPNA
jgi:hypothetical protein